MTQVQILPPAAKFLKKLKDKKLKSLYKEAIEMICEDYSIGEGSLRTAKFLTANVQEFLLENIMIRKMIIILLINMLRVQLKWKETRYAVDSIMAGLRKK